MFNGQTHLRVSTTIIHHVVLCCHVLGLMELGGIKWHLLDPGDLLSDKHLPKSFALVSVLPAQEELLEHRSLSSLWQHLDLVDRG